MFLMHHWGRDSRILPVLAGLLLFLLPSLAQGQRPPAQPDAAQVLHEMKKLPVVGTVLYIAAHPDDENTKLIAWLANGRKVRTGYLSLTRGDGGQNLIGPELGDALGIIRTEELMAARRTDGGEQFFTRASDFGFSKNAEESFEKWGRDEVLSDMVRVIRLFRPDVMITRFPPDRGAGHGHHEASAILAHEAFDLAGDPGAFPEQLEQGLEVWQPRRLFFNGSPWWNRDLAGLAKRDPDWFVVDVGGYDALLGQSYTEIAGRSRSMHKSQGFGAPQTRGEELEYLHLEKGDRPKGKDFLEGIDMTWGRIKGGDAVNKAIAQLVAGYDVQAPEMSVPALERLAAAVDALPDSPWKTLTRKRVDRLLLAVTGTVVEALAPRPYVVTGDSFQVSLIVLTRSPAPVQFLDEGRLEQPLVQNEVHRRPLGLKAPLEVDQPFWLAKPHGSLFKISDPELIGLPVLPAKLQVPYTLRFAGGTVVSGTVPVYYRTVDRVKGDVVQNCEVVPPVSVMARPNLLLVRDSLAETQLEVQAFTTLENVNMTCEMIAGWNIEPHKQELGAMEDGDSRTALIKILAEGTPEPNSPYLRIGTGHPGPADRTRRVIAYDHIPQRSWYTRATFQLEPLDVQVNVDRVGYIMGAGDHVPEALEQMGLKVDPVDPATATAKSLAHYDAVVVGIRAYNMVQPMKELNPALLDYVRHGGTVVVQYTTQSRDMVLPDSLIGPYPFTLTHGRVTVEEAPATFVDAHSPLLNFPNKITLKDFDGWVQERGLYFIGERDPRYKPVIAWNDPGEAPLDGGLLYTDLGQGRWIYTGISFFRQLPAGVPGAYRLFANLIAKRADQGSSTGNSATQGRRSK